MSTPMQLILVNPNSTAAMTTRMAQVARDVLHPANELVALTSSYGPPSIEGYYDEVFAIPPMVDAILSHDGPIDGVVVGCFDDTGVDALRAALDAPVIGICQAAMQAATVLSNGFAVVTAMRCSVPALRHLAHRYGFSRQCLNIRAADVPVLDLEREDSGALDGIKREIEAALTHDNAEAIVLGCAGMADLSHSLSAFFGIPVIEGVGAAVKQVEGLAALGLKTSSTGGYAKPPAKTYKGMFAPFSPGRTD